MRIRLAPQQDRINVSRQMWKAARRGEEEFKSEKETEDCDRISACLTWITRKYYR